jgi:hypothetical protein
VEQDRPRSPPISRLAQASRATGAQCRPRPTSSPPVAEPTCCGPTRAHFHHRVYKPSTPAAQRSILHPFSTAAELPCRHRSMPVSQSSSPPLVVYFRPESPLKLTVLWPLFLQLELLPLCFSSPARSCLMSKVLLCSYGVGLGAPSSTSTPISPSMSSPSVAPTASTVSYTFPASPSGFSCSHM